MKNKIMNSRFIRWLTGTAFSKWLASNRFTGIFWNYEMIAYFICGVLTTVVHYVVYFLMPRFDSYGFDVVLATAVAWLVAVIFAFFVNKVFVFDSPGWDKKTLVREFIPFIVARLLSLGFDALFMWVTVGLLHLNEPLFKIISNVFVLIANYFASKFLIFKKAPAKGSPGQAEENAENADVSSDADPSESTDASLNTDAPEGTEEET